MTHGTLKKPTEVKRRIFVVGVPRSGTTLVQSLLAAHSEVTSFTESHFFSRHFKLLPGSSVILTKNPKSRLVEFLAENDFDASSIAGVMGDGAWASLVEGEPTRLLLPFRTREVAQQLLRVLDQLALSRGQSTWVEKTPKHLRYIPFLEKLAGPKTRTDFVHVVRDGLETVASLHKASKHWQHPYDLETCVERWNADVRFSLSRVQKANAVANDHFVVYEDLTSQPESTLERLLQDLGLAWDPEILERYGQSSSQLVTPEETWKAGVDRGVRRSGTSEQVLTAAQGEWASQALRHDLYTRLREHAA